METLILLCPNTLISFSIWLFPAVIFGCNYKYFFLEWVECWLHVPGTIRLALLPVLCTSVMQRCPLQPLCSWGAYSLTHLDVRAFNAYLLGIFYAPGKRTLLMGDGDHKRNKVSSAMSQMVKTYLVKGTGWWEHRGSCCFIQGSGKGSLIKCHLSWGVEHTMWLRGQKAFQVKGTASVKALRQVCP